MRPAVVFCWISSSDTKHWPLSPVRVVGKNRSFFEQDMQSIVVGRWLELGSSLKAATVWGICKNGHCNGAVSSCSSFFLAVFSYFFCCCCQMAYLKQNWLYFRHKLLVHHTQVEKHDQYCLLLRFCYPQCFILWWCVGVRFWGLTFLSWVGIAGRDLRIISINSLW
jgi:hypothetical protein